ncbi:alpha/beta fold hydrolase [Mycobacterium simiae]|uniref:alpha/beta fold hydrolase n=1 Tax=Mycobacterium simiae TaxID=1784 RepID=UPI000427E1D0|nr:alpha/beta fold hydrolase [Mycobacterium simiae]PLV48800.1 homoserine O-acetyltransferase [Mycobacterium tuberculosis variant microti OV254]BBX42506.1 homoserine O-acetyltransferase [Mycobacterium simiae]
MIPRKLSGLLAVAVCFSVLSCSSSRQASNPHSDTPAPPAQTGQPAVINPRPGDAIFTNYTFRDGETLPELRIHYLTVGEPHKDARGAVDNAVLLLHWTAASSQVLVTQEYKDSLFAPGAPYDVSRFFVIIPDAIGHGKSSRPSEKLAAKFPHYTYSDMVDLQHKLVTEKLGVTHLRVVSGMSMGCMNTWQWAENYPDMMDAAMPVACFPAPISGRNLFWRRIVVDSIKSDPAWAGGNYQQQPPSLIPGMLLARTLVDGVPNLQDEAPTIDKADALVKSTKQQSATQDANDYIYTLEASRDYNAEPDLGKIKAKVFALNFADDEYYRDSLQIAERDVPKVPTGRLMVRPISAGSAGHSSIAHPALWKSQAADFIGWLNQA